MLHLVRFVVMVLVGMVLVENVNFQSEHQNFHFSNDKVDGNVENWRDAWKPWAYDISI